MYRLRLQFDAYPDWTQYQITDCDLATFVDIATGTRVMATMSDDERSQRGIDSGEAYYTAVWDPETDDWVNDLDTAAAEAVYVPWSRDHYV